MLFFFCCSLLFLQLVFGFTISRRWRRIHDFSLFSLISVHDPSSKGVTHSSSVHPQISRVSALDTLFHSCIGVISSSRLLAFLKLSSLNFGLSVIDGSFRGIPPLSFLVPFLFPDCAPSLCYHQNPSFLPQSPSTLSASSFSFLRHTPLQTLSFLHTCSLLPSTSIHTFRPSSSLCIVSAFVAHTTFTCLCSCPRFVTTSSFPFVAFPSKYISNHCKISCIIAFNNLD